jgi:hypothetical protein
MCLRIKYTVRGYNIFTASSKVVEDSDIWHWMIPFNFMFVFVVSLD